MRVSEKLNTFSQKFLLLLSLLSRKRAYNYPFYVDLDITERCNLKCPGCPYHSPSADETKKTNQKDMDFETIVRIFNELKKKTRDIILLGSGEPMMHKRFVDIIKEGKSLGLNLTVLTNGTLIIEKTARELVEAGLNRISISLWDTDKEGYAKTYSVSDGALFNRVVSGIKLIHDVKTEVGAQNPVTVIHFPVSKNNIHKIDKVRDLAVECKVNELSFAPVFDMPGSNISLQLDTDQITLLSEKLREINNDLSDAGIKFNLEGMLTRLKYGKAIWETMPCYVGLYHTKIKADGRVQPCCRCNISLGNIHEQSFEDIWKSEAYQSLRQNTLTKKNLKSFSPQCACSYCSFVPKNYMVFKYDKYISPLAGLFNR